MTSWAESVITNGIIKKSSCIAAKSRFNRNRPVDGMEYPMDRPIMLTPEHEEQGRQWFKRYHKKDIRRFYFVGIRAEWNGYRFVHEIVYRAINPDGSSFDYIGASGPLRKVYCG